MTTEPMQTNEEMPQVTAPKAMFVTLGGALVRITVGRDEYGRTGYGWQCEGCETTTGANHSVPHWAKEDANEHAAVCRAVSPRARIVGETDLGEIRAELVALTETVRDLVAIAGEASREAVRYRERQQGRAWRRGGGQ